MFPDNISYIFQKCIIRRDSLLNSSQKKKKEYLGRMVDFPKIINVNYQNVNTNYQTESQKKHKIEIEQPPTYYPPKKTTRSGHLQRTCLPNVQGKDNSNAI